MITVDPATRTNHTTALHVPGARRPAVPIAKPAAAQMKRTLGLTTVNAAATSTALAGVNCFMLFIQPGVWADRLRRNHRTRPNTINAAPTTMRSHDAQLGGRSRRPPARLDTSRNTEHKPASPNSQPARNARPVGRGRAVSNTSTAGMMVNGDNVTTNPSGTRSVSTAPQLPDIDGPFVAPSPLQNVAS